MSSLLRSCQKLFKMMSESKTFENVMKNIQVTAASPGKVVCEFTVEEDHLNRNGDMHGGFTATLVDQVTAIAVMTKEGQLPGVSVDLNVSYLNGAKAGDLLEIRSECLKFGKSLAFTTVDILRRTDGTLIATGRLTNHVQVTAASPGKIVCEKTVEEGDLNAVGAMHGGVTASLVDQITTLSLMTVDGQLPGSTVDLNVSYLKAARVGDVLELRSECLKYGKTLAFATVDIVKKSDGTLIATGRQTKHVG